MNPKAIREKFGDDYIADKQTFKMGIDHRFTAHLAERFRNLRVLETCTGGGFSTIALARAAKHVFTVEINKSHQEQAMRNVKKAGLLSHVTFIQGNILDQSLLNDLPPVDATFLDPDWAVTGPDHVYRFIQSNTQPPADILLDLIFERTKNVAIILPPFLDTNEFAHLPEHECEKLYLDDNHELFCLYFGEPITSVGETEFRIPT